MSKSVQSAGYSAVATSGATPVSPPQQHQQVPLGGFPRSASPEEATAPYAYGPLHTASALSLLFERARDQLSPADLEWLGGGSREYAMSIAEQAATVIEGIGCLVSNDLRCEPADRAGNFQDAADFPELLWHFSAVFREIRGHLALASAAANLCESQAARGNGVVK